jgi:GT2 family glycosyltransferase
MTRLGGSIQGDEQEISPSTYSIRGEISPVAVVIVNYNTREFLRSCLATVRSETPSKIVVVDNASSDGSAEMVQTDYPWVVLYANKTNLGYGAAANQAIAGCTAKYVLLLNSDTLLPNGALQALSTYLDRHPRAAIVGPRMVNSDGTLQASCFPFPGTLSWMFDNDDLCWLSRRIPVLRTRLLRTWPHNHARVVPWVKGAALMIRRQAFEEVGRFDESFFLYFEETDLCHRLSTIGWETHFAPVTTVVHAGEASTVQRAADMTVQLVASNIKFCRQHYSRTWSAGLVMIMKITIFARFIRDTIRTHAERDPLKRARIAADVAAWQRILLGQLREQSPSDPQ